MCNTNLILLFSVYCKTACSFKILKADFIEIFGNGDSLCRHAIFVTYS